MRSTLIVLLLFSLVSFTLFSPPKQARGVILVVLAVLAVDVLSCDVNIIWGCDSGAPASPPPPPNACSPAADPPNYNGACTSAANSCGTTNQGTIQCGGACSASTPANPPNFGAVCFSPANACGATNQGTIQCNGSCGAQFAPPNPTNYGNSCTSSANSCGIRNVGTINCSNICSATTPAETVCSDPNLSSNSCATISANPTITGLGGSSTLSWSATCGSGQSCAMYRTGDGNILSNSTSGSVSVGPINAPTRYALTCNVGSSVYSNTVIISPSNANSGVYVEF